MNATRRTLVWFGSAAVVAALAVPAAPAASAGTTLVTPVVPTSATSWGALGPVDGNPQGTLMGDGSIRPTSNPSTVITRQPSPARHFSLGSKAGRT